MMKATTTLLALLALCISSTTAFVAPKPPASVFSRSAPVLQVAEVDLDVIGLVVGQENYGLAVVVLGEALYSFLQAPSVGNAARVFGPAVVAAGILGVASGPMVTSGDPAQVATGLSIATGVSVALGASYALRLAAPFSPTPKEIAAVGLLVSIAGFFSFSQNLIVDGFVTLPSLPDLPDLPALPSINLQY
jgi:hypothetical protein